MNDIVFEVLKCFVTVFVLVAVTYVPILLNNLIAKIKDDRMRGWVKDAVEWAEQTIKTGGVAKKEKVVDFVTALALEKGIKISAEQIEILIESAVKQLKG